MNELIQFVDRFNIQTILSMAVILWYFTRDMRKEIQKEISAIRGEIDIIRKENAVQAARSDKLYEMFIQLLREKK